MTSHPFSCRACGHHVAETLVDLGLQPLANSYAATAAEAVGQPRYPLHARTCGRCLLVQVDDVVPAQDIFGDYAYFSSYSDSWLEHGRRFARWAVDELGLGPASHVVEVASNDGYLLRHFADLGIPVRGVEPAANVAAAAREAGIETLVDFFGQRVAGQLEEEGWSADLLVANNVLAHVPDLDDFVRGLAAALRPTGILSVEFPHLLNLLVECQFDTIYHEHYSYFSLLAVERIFAERGLTIFDVHQLPTHGGSLRLLAHRSDGPARPEGEGLRAVRAEEQAAGLYDLASYADFTRRVEAVRDGFLEFVAGLGEGELAGYGAAAKGNTFLNYCGATPAHVAFVVDRSPHKQGRFLPGTGIPILGPDAVEARRPPYLLLLPWNLRAELREQLAGIREWGGRFVIAVPQIDVFD